MSEPRFPQLRAALLKRAARAQSIRHGVDPESLTDEQAENIQMVDEQNTRWFAELVDAADWPTWGMVGVDGAHAAFLIACRAPIAERFHWLPKAREAALCRGVSLSDVAKFAAITHMEMECGMVDFLQNVVTPADFHGKLVSGVLGPRDSEPYDVS